MGTLDELTATGLDHVAIDALIRATLAEDLGGGVDVTSVATVPEDQVATMDLTARAAGVVAGHPGGRARVRHRVGRPQPGDDRARGRRPGAARGRGR